MHHPSEKERKRNDERDGKNGKAVKYHAVLTRKGENVIAWDRRKQIQPIFIQCFRRNLHGFSICIYLCGPVRRVLKQLQIRLRYRSDLLVGNREWRFQ